MKTHTLLALIALAFLSLSASAQVSKSIIVVWDPPPPHEVELVDGYNVYQVFITPPLKPSNYATNIPSPLPAGYTITYKKLNATLIPAATRAFTIPNATPGMQSVCRAYSVGWDTESPDSDILTLRPLPAKPEGLKMNKTPPIQTGSFQPARKEQTEIAER